MTLKTIIGIVLWLVAALTSVAVGNDLVTAIWTGAFPRPNGFIGALANAVIPFVFLVPAYLLTRSDLQRRDARIAVGAGAAAPLLFWIFASYIVRH